MAQVDKKQIFLWSLFDFANSIVLISFYLYFAQWLVIELNVPDLWFNVLFVVSTLMLLFTAPVAGSIADKKGVRMPYLKIATACSFITLLIFAFVALFSQPNLTTVLLTLGLGLLTNYFYQLAFTFYNPMLHDIAPPKLWGTISGIGQFANWAGAIVGILVSLPFVTGVIYLFGNSGRAQTFLPSAVLFLLAVLPMLLLFKERTKPRRVTVDLREEYRNFWRSFTDLWKKPGMASFLLGYLFLNDAVITATGNYTLYLERVFHAPDQTKSFLYLLILIAAAVGAPILGWFADKYGQKKTILLIGIGWLAVLPIAALITDLRYFTFVSIAAGFLFGGVWTVTRAIMSGLSPENRLNESFSYYGLAERFATFIGPLSWGLITYFLIDYGDLRYRVALFAMAAFVLIGVWILRRLPSDVGVRVWPKN